MKRILFFLLLAGSIALADPATSNSAWGISDSSKALHRISIRGKFDSDVIKVQNGALWIEHQSFEKPVDITINGVHWKPDWQGQKSSRYQFSLPLEGFENGTVQVKKVQGRSALASVQLPTAQNQQTLAVKVVDEPVGVDTYEIVIRW